MIKRKTCSIEQCDFPVFGKSYCFYHYKVHIGSKSSLKKSSLKKVSKQGIEDKKEKNDKTKELHNFFISLWQEVKHECQSCGKYLGKEPLSIYFDHLLEKSQYPKYALDKDNIFICCGDCHNMKSNGHPSIKHKEAIENFKNKINEKD